MCWKIAVVICCNSFVCLFFFYYWQTNLGNLALVWMIVVGAFVQVCVFCSVLHLDVRFLAWIGVWQRTNWLLYSTVVLCREEMWLGEEWCGSCWAAAVHFSSMWPGLPRATDHLFQHSYFLIPSLGTEPMTSCSVEIHICFVDFFWVFPHLQIFLWYQSCGHCTACSILRLSVAVLPFQTKTMITVQEKIALEDFSGMNPPPLQCFSYETLWMLHIARELTTLMGHPI